MGTMGNRVFDSSENDKIAGAQVTYVETGTFHAFNYTLAHPWCNGSSSDGKQHHHFDVQEGSSRCKKGKCMAIELVRDSSKNPIMHVWEGKEWLVKMGENYHSRLEWDLFDPVAETTGPKSKEEKDEIIQLKDVEFVQLFESGKVEFVFESGNRSFGSSAKGSFAFTGGLYYDEKVLESRIFTSMQREHFKRAARKDRDTYALRVGASVGLLSLAAAAFVASSLFPDSAVEAVFTLLNPVVTPALGLTFFGTELKVRESKEDASWASRMIFEKLQCLSDFRECSKNILVPKRKRCP